MVEMERIELSIPACKTGVFPLALHPHDFWYLWVGTIHRPPRYQHGALPLSYTGIYGRPGRIRTHGFQFRRLALYPTELQTDVGAADRTRTYIGHFRRVLPFH